MKFFIFFYHFLFVFTFYFKLYLHLIKSNKLIILLLVGHLKEFFDITEKNLNKNTFLYSLYLFLPTIQK